MFSTCSVYPSVAATALRRELRQWLVESGVAYTTSDLAPAVGLLELTGRIERGPFSKATSSRAGHSGAPLVPRIFLRTRSPVQTFHVVEKGATPIRTPRVYWVANLGKKFWDLVRGMALR